MIQIKNRFTGSVIKEIDAAGLYGANLYGANLYGADLSDADLSGADLRSADLRSANLRNADLRSADLRSANLSGADLRSANLRNANLRNANLYGADLSGADLSGANLRNANLYGADLSGVQELLGLEIDPTLPGRIVAQIEQHPETHDQQLWHSSCGTRHCVAGWATTLSGALGKFLDKSLGTATAATLLLWRPDVEMPSFAADATEAETLWRLRAMAAKAAAEIK
jgi:uncharacterized protein YjbI with pentapeptide repeats